MAARDVPGAGEADAVSVAALEARLRALESENAALRAAAPAEQVATSRTHRTRSGWWRALLSAVALVLAAALVPVSVMTAWARAELVNETQFVATLAPLAKDPAVQHLVIDETMKAIDSRVDFSQITGEVITGIKGLGLPPRAGSALDLLQQPAADGLRNLVQTGVSKVVTSDAFANVWTTAVTGAHRALTAVATSDGSGVVVLTADGLGVRLGPIIEQVKTQLVDRGIGVANLIPAVDKTIIVGDGDAVMTVRTVYALADAVGLWLPVVCLALLALGVLLARKRSVAVVGAGVALAVGGGALAVALSIGHTLVGTAATRLGMSAPALDVIYGRLVDAMSHTATIIALVGVLIVVLGWAFGGWSSSRRMQSLVGGLNASARRGLRRRGLDTGRFGAGLYRARMLVHVAAVVVGVAWMFALRPLSGGDVVLVIVVMLAVTWVLELLQRRDGEGPATAMDADGDVAAPGNDAVSDDAAPGDDADDPADGAADRDGAAPRPAEVP